MSKYVQRLGSSITFDKEKEADIIAKIRSLTDSHKLGELISNLLRVYLEEPYKFNDKNQLDIALAEISRLGMSADRGNFFKAISGEINNMKSKIDDMYDMNLKLLTLVQFGKRIGIEDKVNNSLSAQFILEQQVDALATILGVSSINNVYSSNKIHDTSKQSKEILEYIVETYDGIVSEIRQGISTGVQEVRLEQAPKEEVKQVDVRQPEVKHEDSKESKESLFEETVNDDTDIVDFGNANIDALSNFFGEV